MHIGFLIWSFFPAFEGGAERQCRLVAGELARRGVDCTVFSAWLEEEWPETEFIQGIRVRRIGRGIARQIAKEGFLSSALNLLALKLPRLQISVLPAIRFWLDIQHRRAARQRFTLELLQLTSSMVQPIDILHVFETSWLAGVGDMAAERLGAVAICRSASLPAMTKLPYDTPFRPELDRRRRRPYYAAMTPGMIENLVANGIPEARCFLVPNGVEIPDDSAEPKQHDHVLYVGNFSQGGKWKAFDILIRAWAVVHRSRPSARLIMVGGGDASAWKAMADSLGCADSIDWSGAVIDPGGHYRRSSLFVLPSRVEGMSNALLEAQSWGLPCIVSDISGNTCVVDHGINGLVVPANRPQELANAVIRLLDNDSDRKRFGRAARRRAIRDFSISATVDRWVDVYQDILQRHFPAESGGAI